ncbi:sulfurtransferase TusA family protein [Clostridium frigidicarnis]|uniref:TusA-related sulfurtransferase n=1 Tax=Clostridium frigidicarnis TaxID=84698 RepID=A0A1I0XJE0_9CLOT|nr:sulfurtransferase TusA family protein [Clostridium frigidicarnis]SFB00546.1 TusA-related sulfurtransferase [Clostridium frigidicarnis]
MKVDARGMSCPTPVLMTKNATKNNPNELEILVDTKVAIDNVTRFLNHSGYSTSCEDNEEYFTIKAKK